MYYTKSSATVIHPAAQSITSKGKAEKDKLHVKQKQLQWRKTLFGTVFRQIKSVHTKRPFKGDGSFRHHHTPRHALTITGLQAHTPTGKPRFKHLYMQIPAAWC